LQTVKRAGAVGTIINHSEHKLPIETIKSIIDLCKSKDFKVLVCAKSPKEVQEVAQFNPDYIAYEPPELIGGDISVCEAEPELITKSVEKAGEVPLLVGAGVHDKQDIKKSHELGAVGILIASHIVKAKDPKQALLDLII